VDKVRANKQATVVLPRENLPSLPVDWLAGGFTVALNVRRVVNVSCASSNTGEFLSFYRYG